MAEGSKEGSAVLHVVVVGFHHKKGCQVEYSYPPLIPGNPVDSHAIPSQWKHLPSLALPDGAHNFTKDTVYFHLPALTESQETVYGVSCYRQMDATELLNRGSDVTRNTVQKSVCVLSKLPLYGLIQAKLELITHAYFRERDFSHVDLLEDTYKNLSASLSDSLLQGSQAFLGLPIRDVVQCFKHKILILFKLILLERRVLVFGSPVQPICSTLLSLLSLYPGMVEYGLRESASCSSKKMVSPTLKLAKVNDNLDNNEAFLEVTYSNENTKSDNNSHSNKTTKSTDSSSPTDSSNKSTEITNNNVGSGSTDPAPTVPSGSIPGSGTSSVKSGRSMSCSSASSSGRHKPIFQRQMSTGSVPGSAIRTSSISIPQRGNSFDSGGSIESHENLSISPVHNSSHSRHSCEGNVSKRQRGSPNKDTHMSMDDVPDIDELTHVEEVQKTEIVETNECIMQTSKPGSKFDPLEYLGEITKLKSIQKISSRAEQISSSHDDNLSPDEQELLDNDECFSWEDDKLLLEIDEILDSTRTGAKAQTRRIDRPSRREHRHHSGDSAHKKSEIVTPHGSPGSFSLDDPLHACVNRMSYVDDSKYFSDLDLKVHRTVKHSDSGSLKQSDSKSSLDSIKSGSSMNGGEGKGKSLKVKIPKREEKDIKSVNLEMIDMKPVSPTSLQTDPMGLPLAVFTKGVLCHPYLCLQYYDLLQDVNVRGFLIGATNILFKQKRNLLDVVVDLSEPRIEVNDRELAKSLSLTTADLRFADYLVKCVSDDRGDIFLDDTGWEGGDEWIRSQFRMYLLHLLSTVLNDDERLYEDYNVAFIHAWKGTHNFRLWRGTVKSLENIIPGHPFQGGLSVADMKLRFAHSMQSTERGKKISAALGQTGKVVSQTGKSLGGAFSSAKTAVSSWFSSWRGDRAESVDVAES